MIHKRKPRLLNSIRIDLDKGPIVSSCGAGKGRPKRGTPSNEMSSEGKKERGKIIEVPGVSW